MHIKQLIFATLIMLGLVACKNVSPVTSGIGTEQIAHGQNYQQRLIVDNQQLASQLFISDIKTRMNNDFLEVNLALTSKYEKSLALQYQFNWFDKDGFVIESGKNPWQALELHGMQTINVKGLAPSKNAASYSFYVREVNEKFYKF